MKMQPPPDFVPGALKRPMWLSKLEKNLGRPVRVLHLGNIANNGYLNAKIMRRVGIDADCICYDYYHVMGTPEWEDAAFKGDIGDHFYPDWWRVKIKNFKRPSWFYQGPRNLCREGVLAHFSNDFQKVAETRLLSEVALDFVSYKYSKNNRWTRNPLRWPKILLRKTKFVTHLSKKTASNPTVMMSAVNRLIDVNIELGWFYRFVVIALHLLRQLVELGLLFIVILLSPLVFLIKPENIQVLFRYITSIRMHLSMRFRQILLTATSRFIPIGSTLFFKITGRRFSEVTGSHFNELVLGQSNSEPLEDDNFLSPETDAEDIIDEIDPSSLSQTKSRFVQMLKHIAPHITNRPLWFERHIKWHTNTKGTEQRILDEDLVLARDLAAGWKNVFDQYDIVQCYATDGIIPLALQCDNYFAYEHGTLRQIPFDDTPVGRLTASAFQNASAAFVTNLDNLTKADELGISDEQLVCLPHALDDLKLLTARQQNLHLTPDGKQKVVFFSPSRHDWVKYDPNYSKGNNIFLEAAGRLRDEGYEFKLLLVNWGRDVKASRELIRSLNLTSFVQWVSPMKKDELWHTYQSVNAIVDQFIIPAFGSVTFEALTLGRPVVSRIDKSLAKRFFGECPPILHSESVEDTAGQLRGILDDPGDSRGIGEASAAWANEYHSSQRVLDLQLESYRLSLESIGEKNRKLTEAPPNKNKKGGKAQNASNRRL